MKLLRKAALASCAGFALFFAIPAHAMSMKECSAKYQAAKKSGSPMPWTEFRKSECKSAESTASTDADEKPEAAAHHAPEGVRFPSAVDGKFAAETPARQRMKTCLEAYRANRDANTLDGMRWIQKGGGYYSICNARLKGNS